VPGGTPEPGGMAGKAPAAQRPGGDRIDDQRLARVRSAGAVGCRSAGSQPDQGEADRLRPGEDRQSGHADPGAALGSEPGPDGVGTAPASA